MTGQYSQIVKN